MQTERLDTCRIRWWVAAWAVLDDFVDLFRCVHELTGAPLLDPAKVPGDVTFKGYHPVGNYALQFQFSDGHSTGIYTWSLLRQRCECSSCAGEV